jgi:hypothetical protein
MILGIERVIDVHEVEPGRFYLQSYYDEDPVLFQCLLVGEREGVRDLKALRFAPGSQQPVSVASLPDGGPVVALPEVHIRVDAPSLSGTNHTASLRSGMFLVSGDEAFVAVRQGFIDRAIINISTGRPAVGRGPQRWIAFSRWLLVIDDNGVEIAIASFGETEPT